LMMSGWPRSKAIGWAFSRSARPTTWATALHPGCLCAEWVQPSWRGSVTIGWRMRAPLRDRWPGRQRGRTCGPAKSDACILFMSWPRWPHRRGPFSSGTSRPSGADDHPGAEVWPHQQEGIIIAVCLPRK
jgi:hypothetical protein